MKEITVKIPDKKLDFFMELINQLGITISREVEIPEQHKAIVRNRIKKSNENPERFIDWNKANSKFKFD